MGNDIRALGIDVGSTTVKVVGVDAEGSLAWHIVKPTDPRVEDQVSRLLARARAECDLSDGVPVVATGYGRGLVQQAARKATEITCHARGIFRELGHGGTLVDIGGQDSKVIGVTAKGEVRDFAMNDKCAAGTGRFLENTAQRLRVPLDEMGGVAQNAAIRQMLADEMSADVILPRHPQLMGAYGAALINTTHS